MNVLAFVCDQRQFTFMKKIKLEIIINLIYDFFSKTYRTVLVPLPYQHKQIPQCLNFNISDF